jgi:hypothetical protein
MTDNRLLEAFRMFTDNELLALKWLIIEDFGETLKTLNKNLKIIIKERGI